MFIFVILCGTPHINVLMFQCIIKTWNYIVIPITAIKYSKNYTKTSKVVKIMSTISNLFCKLTFLFLCHFVLFEFMELVQINENLVWKVLWTWHNFFLDFNCSVQFNYSLFFWEYFIPKNLLTFQIVNTFLFFFNFTF